MRPIDSCRDSRTCILRGLLYTRAGRFLSKISQTTSRSACIVQAGKNNFTDGGYNGTLAGKEAKLPCQLFIGNAVASSPTTLQLVRRGERGGGLCHSSYTYSPVLANPSGSGEYLFGGRGPKILGLILFRRPSARHAFFLVGSCQIDLCITKTIFRQVI